jgi:hypothetical protein
MESLSPSQSTSTGFMRGAKRALDAHRTNGEGAASSALCRRLEADHPSIFSALCLPSLPTAVRKDWLAIEDLDLRPSFRWEGLSLRIRSGAALAKLLCVADPVALNLRSLRVEGVGLAKVQSLMETGLCEDLRELVLQGCGLAVKGSAFPLSDKVLQVELKGNAPFLLALGDLKALRVLRLAENRLGNRGLACLGGLVDLEGLELRGNSISDPGLAVLQQMPRLQRLGLSNNRIEGPGLSHLATLFQLRKLDIELNPISDLECIRDLQEALPECAIRSDLLTP